MGELIQENYGEKGDIIYPGYFLPSNDFFTADFVPMLLSEHHRTEPIGPKKNSKLGCLLLKKFLRAREVALATSLF